MIVVFAMTSPEHFKIDRSQRMHTGGVVVRVYQIFGTESFGWDTNREQPPSDRARYGSREAAERAADEDHLARERQHQRCVHAPCRESGRQAR